MSKRFSQAGPGKSKGYPLTSLGKYIIITLIYDVTPRNGGGKEPVSYEENPTLETRDLAKSLKTGGCGECQTSCQSACKTSCTVANQKCENKQ